MIYKQASVTFYAFFHAAVYKSEIPILLPKKLITTGREINIVTF